MSRDLLARGYYHMHNPQTEGPPLVGSPKLLIPCIRTYNPNMEVVCSIRNPRMRHAVARPHLTRHFECCAHARSVSPAVVKFGLGTRSRVQSPTSNKNVRTFLTAAVLVRFVFCLHLAVFV